MKRLRVDGPGQDIVMIVASISHDAQLLIIVILVAERLRECYKWIQHMTGR